MAQFILMLRGEEVDFKTFSPEEYQKLVAEFEKFNSKLLKAGKLIGSANLKGSTAKTLRLKEGQIAIDGPYCETKEAVAGIFLFYADDHDQAVELSKDCPFLPIGGSVEVIEIPHLELDGLQKGATS
jgi:hypothetical protein